MKALVSALIIGLSASSALAGPQGSGGGKGVVCRDAHGKIKSVELLDLWEAREVYQQPVKVSKKPVAEQVAAGVQALKYSVQILGPGGTIWRDSEPVPEHAYLTGFLEKISGVFLKDSPRVTRLRGKKLTLTQDSFEPAEPGGRCAIEQIVNFMDAQVFPKILVNQDLVDRMDNTNRAALYLHEALYLYLRGYGEPIAFAQYRESNSIRVRRAIGYVFSGHQFESMESFLPKRYVKCSNDIAHERPWSSFFVYQDTDTHWRLLNAQTFGKPSIGFFPKAGTNVINGDDLLKTTGCENTPPIDMSKVHGGSGYGKPGFGPVDFQMMNWLVWGCDSGKPVWFLTDDVSSNASNTPQRITCELVEKP